MNEERRNRNNNGKPGKRQRVWERVEEKEREREVDMYVIIEGTTKELYCEIRLRKGTTRRASLLYITSWKEQSFFTVQ